MQNVHRIEYMSKMAFEISNVGLFNKNSGKIDLSFLNSFIVGSHSLYQYKFHVELFFNIIKMKL
jgi:hypothetical protein